MTGDNGVFGFGPFLLDSVRRRLTIDAEAVKLPPTQFDTLLYLVKNPGRVVEKDELLAAIWDGGSLRKAISARPSICYAAPSSAASQATPTL